MWTFQYKQDWGGGVGDTCHNLLRYKSWHLIFKQNKTKQKTTAYYYFFNGTYLSLFWPFGNLSYLCKDIKVRDPDLLIILEGQE